MFPAFITGLVLKHYFEKFQQYTLSIFIITCCIFLLMLLPWDAGYWTNEKRDILEVNPNDIKEWLMFGYYRYYRIIIGFFGSMTFVSMAMLLFKTSRHGKVIDTICDWGKYTLTIYVLQSLILEVYMAHRYNFDSLSFGLFNFVVSPLISLGILILCVYISKLLMQSKLTARLLCGQIPTK